MTGRVRAGMIAGAVAGALSGIPSTVVAFARREDPLAATLAAGAVLLPDETRKQSLLAAAVPVHAGVSLTWGVVLAHVLPRRRPVLEGALAGVVITVLDLGLVARVSRRFRRVRELPPGPQLADHVAFGAIVGAVLGRRS